MEAINNNQFQFLTKFLTQKESIQRKGNEKQLGLKVSNTDPNIKKSISRIKRQNNEGIDNKKVLTLKKMKEDQKIASLSPKGKKPINSINHNGNINSTNHNGNIHSKHTIIKSNSFTNNKLPLLTIQDKKLNSVSPISFRDSIKKHIKINNNKLKKKIKQDYFGCNRINFELMRMSKAIKYMLNSNKKQNNILKTVKSRKFALKGNTGNENKNKGSIDTSIKPRSNNSTSNSNNTKPMICNNKYKIDTETEEDSFDIPEDEQIKAEILCDSSPISINYPRIIKNPPVIFNYIISPTEQYIAKKYKNYHTIQDRMLCNKNYKHTALQTEPLGIIKEEDEQSDLTKTHSSLNKKRSILLESKNYTYLMDNDKQITQTDEYIDNQCFNNHYRVPFISESNKVNHNKEY